jgi:hypothetical protein
MDASIHIKVNFSMLWQSRAKTNSIIFLKHALLFIGQNLIWENNAEDR